MNKQKLQQRINALASQVMGQPTIYTNSHWTVTEMKCIIQGMERRLNPPAEPRVKLSRVNIDGVEHLQITEYFDSDTV